MASKTDTPLDIPPAWNSLDYPAFKGILMVVGAPDMGKSSLRLGNVAVDPRSFEDHHLSKK